MRAGQDFDSKIPVKLTPFFLCVCICVRRNPLVWTCFGRFLRALMSSQVVQEAKGFRTFRIRVVNLFT